MSDQPVISTSWKLFLPFCMHSVKYVGTTTPARLCSMAGHAMIPRTNFPWNHSIFVRRIGAGVRTSKSALCPTRAVQHPSRFRKTTAHGTLINTDAHYLGSEVIDARTPLDARRLDPVTQNCQLSSILSSFQILDRFVRSEESLLPFLSIYLFGYSLKGCFSAELISTSQKKNGLRRFSAISIVGTDELQCFLAYNALYSLWR